MDVLHVTLKGNKSDVQQILSNTQSTLLDAKRNAEGRVILGVAVGGDNLTVDNLKVAYDSFKTNLGPLVNIGVLPGYYEPLYETPDSHDNRSKAATSRGNFSKFFNGHMMLVYDPIDRHYDQKYNENSYIKFNEGILRFCNKNLPLPSRVVDNILTEGVQGVNLNV